MRKKFTDYMQSVHIDYYAIVPFDSRFVINENKLRRHFPNTTPKSVMIFIAPYFTGIYPQRNVSLYAVPHDYHIFFDKIYADFIGHHGTEFTFKGYADNSPLNEVQLASAAGLGIIGDNGLLINERYGSFIFIGEIITDYQFDVYDEIKPIQFQSCVHCGKCKNACPSPDKCLSAITQKRGNLTEHEITLIRDSGIAWGCDICQLVCPYNQEIPVTEICFFHENLKSVIDENCDIINRAYSWRGEKCIRRNVAIVNQGKDKK